MQIRAEEASDSFRTGTGALQQQETGWGLSPGVGIASVEAFQLHGMTGLLVLQDRHRGIPGSQNSSPAAACALSLQPSTGTGSFPVLTALPSTFPPSPTQGIKTQILI